MPDSAPHDGLIEVVGRLVPRDVGSLLDGRITATFGKRLEGPPANIGATRCRIYRGMPEIGPKKHIEPVVSPDRSLGKAKTQPRYLAKQQ